MTASADSSGAFQATWQAPASDGGSAITGYTVLVTPQNGGTAQTVNVAASSPLQAQVTGLSFGVTYCAQVQAANAVGGGPTSPAGQAFATPQQDAPRAPGNVRAVQQANDRATVSWKAASPGPFNTPVTRYTVSVNGTSQVTATGLSASVTGLRPGAKYAFSVTATNANGHQGPASTATALTTWNLPGPRTKLTLAAGNSTVAVSWSPPSSTGGTAVTGYEVSINGVQQGLQASGHTFPAAPNQPATVAVVAVNAVGRGTAATGGATPFQRVPSYICMSDTRHFLYNWPATNCDHSATNLTSYVGPGAFSWVLATAPQPPGARFLYMGFVTNWEEWKVGSPPPNSLAPGPVAWAWTSPQPGATEICEGWRVDPNAMGGGYYLLYVNGSQPAASPCIATFWL